MNSIINRIKNDPFRYLIYAWGRSTIGSPEKDAVYLRKLFKHMMGRELDLRHPKSLNEKLQWLKIHDRNPIQTIIADKYASRQYIAQHIGADYLVPLIGVWDTPESVPYNVLPSSFVLKTTHDSGGVVVCRGKDKFDKEAANRILKKSFNRNYYINSREWAYKDIKPRIICEELLVDETGWDLKDYKIFCFNGKPAYIEVDYNRSIRHMLNAYDVDWNLLNFCDSSPNDPNANIVKPKCLDEMLEIAKVLSKDFNFLRVDLYSIESKVYCGELTLYPGGGCIQFNPPSTDYVLGSLLKLPCEGGEIEEGLIPVKADWFNKALAS